MWFIVFFAITAEYVRERDMKTNYFLRFLVSKNLS